MKVNNQEHWLIKPETKPIPRDVREQANFQNLLGAECGALRVVGFLGRKGGQSVARWLTRCMCGAYEPRTAKAIKGAASATDECVRCRYKRQTAGQG